MLVRVEVRSWTEVATDEGFGWETLDTDQVQTVGRYFTFRENQLDVTMKDGRCLVLRRPEETAWFRDAHLQLLKTAGVN